MRAGPLVGIATLALLGTQAAAQDITYDYDKSADFTRFKTYAWVRGTEVKDPLNHRRIVLAIDAQLAAKGLSKTDQAGKPDLLVTYHVALEQEKQINGYGTGGTWGTVRWGGMSSGSARVQTITVGSLAVDLVDAQAGAIVWRGIASKDLDDGASPEKRDKNMNKAAEKLFKNYPPKP
jgi:hypothetical protein